MYTSFSDANILNIFSGGSILPGHTVRPIPDWRPRRKTTPGEGDPVGQGGDGVLLPEARRQARFRHLDHRRRQAGYTVSSRSISFSSISLSVLLSRI